MPFILYSIYYKRSVLIIIRRTLAYNFNLSLYLFLKPHSYVLSVKSCISRHNNFTYHVSYRSLERACPACRPHKQRSALCGCRCRYPPAAKGCAALGASFVRKKGAYVFWAKTNCCDFYEKKDPACWNTSGNYGHLENLSNRVPWCLGHALVHLERAPAAHSATGCSQSACLASVWVELYGCLVWTCTAPCLSKIQLPL